MRYFSKFVVVASVWASCLAPQTQPSARAQNLLNRLESKLNQLLAPTDANPDAFDRRGPIGRGPGYLGLKCETDEDLNVLMVREVVAGSPAERAGFQVNDELLSIDNMKVRRLDDMSATLERLSAGTVVEFEIRRDDRRMRIQATLGQRGGLFAPQPDERRGFENLRLSPPGINPTPENFAARAAERPSLGITVAPVSDEARARFALTVRRGALITALRQGGAGDRFGLPIGGAIVAFNGQRIDTPDDLIQAVQNSRVGEEVELTYYEAEKLFRKKLNIGASYELPADPNARIDGTLEPPLVLAPGRSSAAGSLDRLEGTLEQPTPAVGPIGVLKPKSQDEVSLLRKQMETMQRQIDDLQQRLRELEGRSGVLPPPPAPLEK